MSRIYLKKAQLTPKSNASEVHETVKNILTDIEAGGDEKAKEYASKFDQYQGNIILTDEEIEAASELVPAKLKKDIEFAHDNVRRFAEKQKETLKNTEIEIHPGFVTGQKVIPVDAAGCYVPGGRYSHIASAIMTVTTAKVAGCKFITACSPPKPNVGVAPAIIYAAHICGADKIIAMGGVQGVASMTYGLFGLPQANILVGPGNQFVAEAKRILFGRVGIDMIAGPTDSLILADETADPFIVATDLVSQAEHGYNSPVWLITNNEALASKVMNLVPKLIDDLPETNRDNAAAAWRDYAEVIVCDNYEEMLQTSEAKAFEHVQVMTDRDDWFLEQMTCYGALFLGPRTNVANGDKVIGTNHTLPTKKAGRYTGGLWVGKFLKTHSYQKILTDKAATILAEKCSRLCILEGFVGHAEQANIRARRYGRINIEYGKAAK